MLLQFSPKSEEGHDLPLFLTPGSSGPVMTGPTESEEHRAIRRHKNLLRSSHCSPVFLVIAAQSPKMNGIYGCLTFKNHFFCYVRVLSVGRISSSKVVSTSAVNRETRFR